MDICAGVVDRDGCGHPAGPISIDGGKSAGVDMRLACVLGVERADPAAALFLLLAPSRRVSEANGDSRLAVLPERDGKRRASVRMAGGGVCTSGCRFPAGSAIKPPESTC